MASEKGITVVSADDTREALGEMSRAFFGYPEKYLTMIGITGTQGKLPQPGYYTGFWKRGDPDGLIGTTVFLQERHFSVEKYYTGILLVQKYLRMMADNGCRAAVMEVSSQALMCGRVHGIFLIMLFLQTFHQTISALESMALMKNIFTGKAVFSQCHTGI